MVRNVFYEQLLDIKIIAETYYLHIKTSTTKNNALLLHVLMKTLIIMNQKLGFIIWDPNKNTPFTDS